MTVLFLNAVCFGVIYWSPFIYISFLTNLWVCCCWLVLDLHSWFSELVYFRLVMLLELWRKKGLSFVEFELLINIEVLLEWWGFFLGPPPPGAGGLPVTCWVLYCFGLLDLCIFSPNFWLLVEFLKLFYNRWFWIPLMFCFWKLGKLSSAVPFFPCVLSPYMPWCTMHVFHSAVVVVKYAEWDFQLFFRLLSILNDFLLLGFSGSYISSYFVFHQLCNFELIGELAGSSFVCKSFMVFSIWTFWNHYFSFSLWTTIGILLSWFCFYPSPHFFLLFGFASLYIWSLSLGHPFFWFLVCWFFILNFLGFVFIP